MPANIIRDGDIVQDQWQLVEDAEQALPDGDIIVPLALWQAQKDALIARGGNLGVWLDSNEGPEEISADLARFSIVAIRFPAFADGRGYSYARLLRERYGYENDIRAIGDVMQDQLFYMQRCGFSSFALKEGRDVAAALASFNPIHHTYQASANQPDPLYRRKPD